MTIERNWLIRTSQNQILGPVAKEKLLEFIEKGALGFLDEVASGNGYWFSLKEKDLVEKYLYGDIPQGYNPISEAKSTLAKQENPEKTTSINTAPANATQVIRLDDLNLKTPLKLKENEQTQAKLPDSEDLEFPEPGPISPMKIENLELAPIKKEKTKEKILKPQEDFSSKEEILLPNEEDLEFPSLDSHKTSTKIEKGKVDLSKEYTRTVALDTKQADEALVKPTGGAKKQQNLESDFGEAALKLNVGASLEKKEEIKHEEKKLLHERKVKPSLQKAARDPTREVAHQKKPPTETLKKRNDNYLFFILIIVALILIAVFFYFKEILNKPLPV